MDLGDMERKANALFEQLRSWQIKSRTTNEEDEGLKTHLDSLQSEGLIILWRPQEMAAREMHYVLRFADSWMPPMMLLVLGCEIRFLRPELAREFLLRYGKHNFASKVQIVSVTVMETSDRGEIQEQYQQGVLPKSTANLSSSKQIMRCG